MPLDIQRIQAICFDIDGTLRDTDDQYVLRLIKWINPIGFMFRNNDPSAMARRIVMSMEEPGNFLIQIPDRLGIDKPIAHLLNFFDDHKIIQPKSDETIIPGVIACLKQLHPSYPLSIVSARGERQSLRFLSHFGLTHFFNGIATAQTTPHAKPFPDPIIWAARQMGVDPGECLMVGDTTVDIIAAKAAGAQSVGVLSGFGEKDELLQSGADLIIPSVASLPVILKEKIP